MEVWQSTPGAGKKKTIITHSEMIVKKLLSVVMSAGGSHVTTQTHIFIQAVFNVSVQSVSFSHDAKTQANTSSTLHSTAWIFPLNFA